MLAFSNDSVYIKLYLNSSPNLGQACDAEENLIPSSTTTTTITSLFRNLVGEVV